MSEAIGDFKLVTSGRKLLGCELDTVFAFTYVTGFFQKLGFDVVERGVLRIEGSYQRRTVGS